MAVFGLALPVAAGGGSEAPAAGAAPKQVTMRFSWWGGDTRHKATLAAIEAYQKKNPHVKIEAEYGGFDSYYQKLVTQLAGGGAADIIQIDYKWVHDLGAQGKLFVDMNTLKKDIDMSGFDMDFAKSYGAHGDYLLGLPTGLNAMALLANIDLLEKAGVKFKDNWTWEEVLEVGAKMHSANKSWYLIGSQPQQLLYLLKTQMKQKTGNDIIKDDLTLGFEKKDLVESFEYIRKALEVGAFAPLEEVVLYDGKGWDQIPNWLNATTAWPPPGPLRSRRSRTSASSASTSPVPPALREAEERRPPDHALPAPVGQREVPERQGSHQVRELVLQRS
jgi:oligogalacturonide transport system substrate-binding protein